MLRRAWLLLRWLVVAMAAILTGIVLLVRTEPGTQFVVDVIDSAMAERVNIGQVTGALSSTLTLNAIDYADDSVRVEAEQLSVSWLPAGLFDGTLFVTQLEASGLDVVLLLPDTPQAQTEPLELRLPFAFVFQAVRVSGMRIEREDAVFDIDSARLSASGDEREIGVHALSAQGPTWRASLSGSAVPSAPFPMRLHAQWSMLAAQSWNGGSVRIDGDSEHLSFTTSVAAPFELQSEGKMTRRGDDISLTANGHWGSLTWPLTGDPLYASDHGKFSVSGDLDDFRLTLDGDFRSDAVPIEQFSLSTSGTVSLTDSVAFEIASEWGVRTTSQTTAAGRLTANGDADAFAFEHELSEPFVTGLSGRFDQTSGVVVLDLQGAWQNAEWPLDGTPAISSPAGEFSVRGSLDALELNLTAEIDSGEPLEKVSIAVDSELTVSPVVEFDSRFEWHGLLAGEQVRLEGQGTAAGALDGVIKFSHELSMPFAFTSQGSVALDDEQLTFDVTSNWSDLAWPPTPQARLRSATGEFSAGGRLSDFTGALRADVDIADVPIREIELALSGGVDSSAASPSYQAGVDWLAKLVDGTELGGSGRALGNDSTIDLEHQLTTPFAIGTRGQVVLGEHGPEVDLTGGWTDLHWPLSPPLAYHSKAGEYALSGPVDALSINVTTDVSMPQLPDVAATLAGVVDPNGINLTTTTLALLNGEVASHGRVAWSPVLSWALDVEASGIEPGAHWPQWPARLDATVDVTGQMDEHGLHTTLDITRVAGQLRDHPVSARGAIDVRNERIEARGLSLTTGSNRLDIDGVYDQQAELSFVLEAPDLSQVLPGLHGKVSGRGSVSGTLAAPSLLVELVASDMSYQEHNARAVSLNAEISPVKTQPSHLALNIEQANAGGQQFETVDVTVDGTLDSHHFTVSLESSIAAGALELEGGLQERSWQGRLTQMTLDTPAAGVWSLEAPATLELDRTRATLGATCLIGGTRGKACTLVDWTAEKGIQQANVEISDLSLGLADPWLPNESSLTGNLNLSGEVHERTGQLQGDFSASVSAGDLTFAQTRSKSIVLSHAQTSGRVQLAGENLNVSLDSVVGGAGRVKANVSLAALTTQRRLSGSVEATLAQLDVVTPFVTALDAVDGDITVRATLGGTLSAPQVNGRAELQLGSAAVVPIGVEVIDSNVVIDSDSNGAASLSGTFYSGGGELSVTGQGLLDAVAGFPFDVTLEGTDFEVIRLPLAQVFASPSLRLAVNEQHVSVSGTVVVPKATITPEDVSASAIKVSSDEVILDQPATESAPASSPVKPILVDVTVELGDDVVFDGFGLTSKLSGRLAIAQNLEGTTTGQGNLDLVGGQYRAYGQRLEIERGRLLFAGPLDNPGLDVRAVRKSGNVTAGILIGGTVNSLRSQVFSEPALSEAEALSYLLTGRGLSGASKSEAALLSQAALSLGLQGAPLITQQLQSAFGLDEVSVGGSGQAGNTSLILGKRITPDITVRYALGLFDTVGAFFLNYRLTDNLSLETESGESQGVDLLYNIETDSLLP